MIYQFNHLGSPDYIKIERGENYCFQPHLHQCFEIIIILSGEMKVSIDYNDFTLRENEALLIFPNQIHSLRSTTSKHMLCIFSPRLVQAFASKLTDKIPVNNKFSPDSYLITALSNLTIQSMTSEKKGVLYSLCAQFEKNAEYKPKPSEKEDLLYKIFAFVESNFNKDCSLSTLAQSTGYDYSYLSRYFRKIVGISYNSYVNHSRLSNACYLMENSDIPIIQCAYESGYTSLRTFNRNFKAYYNVTPIAYRRNIGS